MAKFFDSIKIKLAQDHLFLVVQNLNCIAWTKYSDKEKFV